jgi:predicted DNA-binding ribbon-helix-helix protein
MSALCHKRTLARLLDHLVSSQCAFWTALKESATARWQSLAELIGTMDGARQTGNRSAPRRMTPGQWPFEGRFAATSD